jgi:hypothetical protein
LKKILLEGNRRVAGFRGRRAEGKERWTRDEGRWETEVGSQRADDRSDDGTHSIITARSCLNSVFMICKPLVFDMGSGFRVKKKQTNRIKGIVPSSGYKSLLANGVFRVYRILINIALRIHRL